VFQSSLFIDYGAGPKAEELARTEWAKHARDAEKIIVEEGSGVSIRLQAAEGEPEQELLRCAMSEQPDVILATPRYKGITKGALCPVYIIMPGTILVPVDNSDAALAGLDKIMGEAKATGSNVLLLGIVSVHLYSAAETKELEQVRNGTVAAMKKIKKTLAGQNIEVSELIRSRYPDEEILKAAREHAASLIILPGGGKLPRN
jgi:nucleotide-binding universal stress UspA family protein